jgi:hypothetical protein
MMAGASNDWCFKFGAGGPEVRCSRLSVVHAEQGCGQLLSVEGDHRVVVESLTEGVDCDCRIHVDGGAVTVHGSSFGRLREFEWILSWAATSRNSTVRFRDCLFNFQPSGTFDPLWIINSPTTNGCFYSFEKCDYHYLNRPFDDVRSAW